MCVLIFIFLILETGWRPWASSKGSDSLKGPCSLLELQQILDQSARFTGEMHEQMRKREDEYIKQSLEFSSLEAMNDQLKAAIDQVGIEKQSLVERCSSLETKEKELLEHCAALEARGGGSDDRVPDLEAQVQALESEKVKLEGRMVELQSEVNEFVVEKSTLSGRVTELEEQVRQLKEAEAAGAAKVKEAEAAVKRMEENRSHLQRMGAELEASRRNAAEQSGALQWLMRTGVPFCIRSVLASPEFREAMRDLQGCSIRFGVDKGCRATHSAYEDLLEGKSLIHSFPNAKAEAKTKLDNMLTRSYPMMIELESGRLGFLELWRQAAEQEARNRARIAEEVARVQAETAALDRASGKRVAGEGGSDQVKGKAEPSGS